MRERWAGAEWRTEAQRWIRKVLTEHNISQTGDLEQPRIRFWSTQLTVPTNHGRLWFKENHAGQSAEASVVACLAGLVPDRVVPPLSIEPSRGWMLTPDHGATLATLNSSTAELWSRVVTDFAALQKQLTPHGEKLAEAGLISMNPDNAATFVGEQLLLHTGLPPEHSLHLNAESADQIHGSISALAQAAGALSALGIPLSLEHNDLHSNNAFIPGSGTEPLRFFDFADSYWAHPFSSLLVPITVMREQWETTYDDARIRRVVNAYLEQWTDYAPLRELRTAVGPALKLGRLNRYGSWLRLLLHADRQSVAEYGPHTLHNLTGLMNPVH